MAVAAAAAPPAASEPAGGPLVLEFVGLPGAGKSTLARALVAALKQGGAMVELLSRPSPASARRRDRAADLVSLLASSPALGLRCLALGGATTASAGLTAALLRRLRVADACASSGVDLAILDEGLVQGLWSLTVERGSLAWGRAASLMHPLLDGRRYRLVLVEARVEDAAARVASRTERRGRFDGLDASVSAPRLDLGSRHLEALLAAAPVGVEIHRIPAASDASDAVPALWAAACRSLDLQRELTVTSNVREEAA